MRFLNPFGLLGLFTVPVIIGLHLHLERNRRVIVSSMFLWSFLDVRFEGKKPQFIRLSWLLLLDILIAVLFSLAFARPQLILPDLAGQSYDQVILLDDSTSMLAQDGDPDRFSLALDMARTLINGAGRGADTLVLTIGGKIEVVGSSREISQQSLLSLLDDLRAGDSGVSLREGLAAAEAFADFDNPLRVFVITDGAFSQPEVSDFPFPVQWVFVGFDNNNQAIINPIMKEVDDTTTEIFYQLANFSGADVGRDAVLLADGAEVDRKPVILPASSVLPQTVRVSGKIETVQIYLSGFDTFPVDDQVALGAVNRQEVQVALVANSPYPLDRAIEAYPDAELSVIPPIDFTTSGGYDLVIFRDYMPEFMPPGNVLVFDPPMAADSLVPVTGITPLGSEISANDHAVLEGINLNAVRWQNFRSVDVFAETFPLPVSQVLVQSGTAPIFVELENEGGSVFLFLPELSGGNLTSHPTFPVLISNIIEYSREINLASDYQLGDSLSFAEFEGFLPESLSYPGQDAGEDLTNLRGARLYQTGLYTLEMLDIYGHSRQFVFGVNAGSLSESNISPREWRSAFGDVPVTADETPQLIEYDLSPWLLGMAMVLFVVEAWRAWR